MAPFGAADPFPAPAAAAVAPSSSLCLPALAHFEALPPPDRPPAVRTFGQSPCTLGPDESTLGFLSNQSGSGSRVAVSLTLPPVGSGIGSTLTGLSVRLWVSGIPCSVGGASLLDLELQPPLSGYAASPSTNWSVRGPVYDLVPPASCDPTCTNDSALVTYQGLPYCEGLALRPSSGLDPTTWTGGLTPGDHLLVTFLGTFGGSAPLTLLLNDSDHPSSNRVFVYSSDRTVTGRPLEPWSDAAKVSASTWANSAGVAVAATLCPSPGDSVSSCLSYNRTLVESGAPVRVESVVFWNASTGSYSNGYDGVAAVSSTLACRSTLIPCSGFSGPSGGFYPYWTLHGDAGQLSWQFGGAYPSELRSYAALADQPPSPVPSYEPTIVLTGPTAVAEPGPGSYMNVSIRASAAAGVAQVEVVAGILSVCIPPAPATITLYRASMVRSLTAGNTSDDGLWNVSIFFAGREPGGVLHVLLQARSSSGQLSPNLSAQFAVQSINGCSYGAPSAPTMNASDVTPTPGGYWLRWNESDPSVVGYSLSLRPAVGPPVVVGVGNVTSARVDLGAFNTSYTISLTAVAIENLSSTPTAGLAAPPTLGPFSVSVLLPPGPLWLVASNASFGSSIAGGVAPYNLSVDFGDGSNLFAVNASPSLAFSHDYGLYYGNALVSATVTDALGDVAATGPWPLPIWATPLGVAQFLSAGDSAVNLSFALPPSPSDPAHSYTVLWTTSAQDLWDLGSAVFSNATLPGVSVWNTTNTYLRWTVPNGVPVYAEVRASNFYGLGALPDRFQIATATAAPLTVSPIGGLPGGPAPFQDNLTATVTGGTGDALTTALYSYPPNQAVAATVTDVNGSLYVNATVTFPSPGTFVVVLHVVDVFFDIQVAITRVVVSDGAPPTLAIDLLNPPAYAGSPLHFQATASGGSGFYQYAWSFGDGGTSPVASPSHLYNQSGAYTVVLTAIDLVTGGVNVTELPVTIYSVPILYVSVSQGPNGTLSYDFRASVGGGSGNSTVVWTFGDGTVARGTVVSHDFRLAGTYGINVTATDPAGRAGTTSFNLTVHPGAPSPGGGGGGVGLSSLDTLLLVLTVGLAAITLLLLRQRRPPAEEEEPERVPFEDGEVSLT